MPGCTVQALQSDGCGTSSKVARTTRYVTRKVQHGDPTLDSDALASSCPRLGVLCVRADITLNMLKKWIREAARLDIDHRLVNKFTQTETAQFFQDSPISVFCTETQDVTDAKVTLEKVRLV